MIWLVALVLNSIDIILFSRFRSKYMTITGHTVQVILLPGVGSRSHSGAGTRPSNSNCHTLTVEVLVGICDRYNVLLSAWFWIITVSPDIYIWILTCRNYVPPICSWTSWDLAASVPKPWKVNNSKTNWQNKKIVIFLKTERKVSNKGKDCVELRLINSQAADELGGWGAIGQNQLSEESGINMISTNLDFNKLGISYL